MLTMETWWEDIFSGPLSIGLNESKIYELRDESFLFFSNDLPSLRVTETMVIENNVPWKSTNNQ